MPPHTIRQSLLGIALTPRPVRRAARPHRLDFRRGEATYRRHIKRLSIPPAPSFAPQKQTKQTLDAPQSSHIVFNPPSTTPNVYHTPLKFLPASDKRRHLYNDPHLPNLYNISTVNERSKQAQMNERSPMASPGTALHEIARSMPPGLLPRVSKGVAMPPPIKSIREKTYHLTPQQVLEMQQLRQQDPVKWSIHKLAEKYGCGTFFVRLCAKNVQAGQNHAENLELVKSKWGKKKTIASEDRKRRKALWGRDA